MTDAPDSAFQDAKAEVNFLRWIFGWNLPVGWLMVTFLVGGVGYFIGFVYEFGLLGFLLGFPAWFYGTRYIDAHYESLRDGYLADVEQFGPMVLQRAGADPEAEYFVLEVTPESTPFRVDAPTQFDATVLAVESDTLWIYDETTFDVMFLEGTIGTDPEEVTEIPIADLETLVYQDRELELHLTDEAAFYVPSSTEPNEVMAAIGKRMVGRDSDG